MTIVCSVCFCVALKYGVYNAPRPRAVAVCIAYWKSARISREKLFHVSFTTFGHYKPRRSTWIILAWSEHLKLHPCWLLIGWQKNCRNQPFSEGWDCPNFRVAKKCRNQTLSEGQGILSIFQEAPTTSPLAVNFDFFFGCMYYTYGDMVGGMGCRHAPQGF